MTYVGVSKEWLKNHAVEFLSNIDTSELVQELCKRDGVTMTKRGCVAVWGTTHKDLENGTAKYEGAARILVVID
jgi:hypothetical protein